MSLFFLVSLEEHGRNDSAIQLYDDQDGSRLGKVSEDSLPVSKYIVKHHNTTNILPGPWNSSKSFLLSVLQHSTPPRRARTKHTQKTKQISIIVNYKFFFPIFNFFF